MLRRRVKLIAAVAFGVSMVYIAILVLWERAAAWSAEAEPPAILAWIDGEPVEQGEWRLVFAQYRDKEAALQALIRLKMIQREAVRYGLLASAGYANFVEELEMENARRQAALEQGEWIAGPQRYTAANYYNHRQVELTNRLTDRLLSEAADSTQQTLSDYYDANIERFGQKHDAIDLHYVAIPIDSADLADYGEARRGALTRMEKLRLRLQEGDSFEAIYAEQSQLPGGGGAETVDDSNYRDISKYRNDFYHAALALDPGEISPVVEDGNRLVIIYCSSREAGGYRSFEEVREEVKQRYFDDLFEQYIDELASEAKVEPSPLYKDMQ